MGIHQFNATFRVQEIEKYWVRLEEVRVDVLITMFQVATLSCSDLAAIGEGSILVSVLCVQIGAMDVTTRSNLCIP